MNPESQQPVAPAPSQPQPTAPTPTPMATGGGKSKKNMLIIIVVAAVVLVAAIAYGVYAYISNTPENLMKAAVENISKEKALGGTIKVTGGTDQNGVTFTGDFAATDDAANTKNGEIIVGLGTGDQRVGLSALSLDGTMYLKTTNAERLGTLLASFSPDSSASLSTPQFAAALKNLNDQWFELTKEEVQSLAQSSGNTNVAGAISPEDLKKVLEIYNQHPFVKANKTYPDEVVDGSNSAHFSIKSDNNDEVAFMQAVKAANLSTIKVTDADIADAKNAPATTDATLEVWIARDSKKFKQVRLITTKKGSESTIILTLTNKLPTFDKLEKPASVKPISELLTTLLGPSVSPAELNALQSQSVVQ